MEEPVEARPEITLEEQVFGLEELLTSILEHAKSICSEKEMLSYRTLGKLWAKCANKMFKVPPLKLHLDKGSIAAFRRISKLESSIPVEVIVKKQGDTGGFYLDINKKRLTRENLEFLSGISYQIERLVFDNVDTMLDEGLETPTLPNLKYLRVNIWCKPGIKRITVLEYANEIAKIAPKLEKFVVFYHGSAFADDGEFAQKSFKGFSLPDLVTDLYISEVCHRSLLKFLTRTNPQNLARVEFIVSSEGPRSKAISRALQGGFVSSSLQVLEMYFRPSKRGIFWVEKMPYLKELGTNMAITAVDEGVPLSECLPELTTLMSRGIWLTNFEKLVVDGSLFKNLKKLILRGWFGYRGPLLRAAEDETRLVEAINQIGFPASPNLESLTWTGFSSNLTEICLPRIFASATRLRRLETSVDVLLQLCNYFRNQENNQSARTTFSRLTEVIIIPYNQGANCPSRTGTTIFSEELFEGISAIMIDLKTLTLQRGIFVKQSVKALWEQSGKKMIVDLGSIME